MDTKKLTGWLILLIVLLVLSLGNVATTFDRMDKAFQPYLASYPSVATAFMVYKFLGEASVCAGLYTAWILFRREPGTLRNAKTGLLLRCLLILGAGFSVPLFAGLPPERTQRLILQTISGSVMSILFTAVWFLYLLRSDRVREIYTA